MTRITTKERIIDAALSLFAEQGYEAVSVAQIAGAVGIKAPSLYKHFKSKQDIFDGILVYMESRYEQQAASVQMDGANASSDLELFKEIDGERLAEMGRQLFLYFLHDEYVCKFRKMLTLEQFHSNTLASLYSRQYIDGPLEYQSMLFGLLSQAGILRYGNQQVTALHFYAPIYLLLTECDRCPRREEECLRMLEEHIKQFSEVYQTGGKM